MKTVSALLTFHLGQETSTLATCWKVTRGDLLVFGFTDHSEDIPFNGVTYLASSGISASNIITTAALDVDNLEVESVLNSDTITDADLLAGLWDGAEVEIFQVNWSDLTQGILPLRSGTIGEVRTGRLSFAAELRGPTQKLQQSVGRVYGAACDTDLGSAKCGVNLASFTGTGSVLSISDNSYFQTDLAAANGYYDYGKITFTSGANAGLSMEVKSYTSSWVRCQMSLPYEIQVGDTFSIHAGCDKTLATCRDRFSQVVNFRGFPHIPGLDRMVSGK